MIGERIKLLRKKHDLSQSEFGTIMSVSNTTISNWETGFSKPSYEELKKLAQFFNVTTDYLLGIDEDKRRDMEVIKDYLVMHHIIKNPNDISEDEFIKTMSLFGMMKESIINSSNNDIYKNAPNMDLQKDNSDMEKNYE